MKLTEVSTGAHTLKFADYIQHLKQIGLSAKTIGELHTIGVNCLKGGAVFEDGNDDDVRMTFRHGYVQFPNKVESKAFFVSRIGLYMNHGDDPAFISPSSAVNQGYLAFGINEATTFNFSQYFKLLEAGLEAISQARDMLGND